MKGESESLKLGWSLVRKKKIVEGFGWKCERTMRARGSAKSSG